MNPLINILFLFILLGLVCNKCLSTNPVWNVKDRFSGFRFEIDLKKSDDPHHHHHCQNALKKMIQHKANKIACFGWIQDSPRGTLVGEARCNKQMGYQFKRIIHGKDFVSNKNSMQKQGPKEESLETSQVVGKQCIDAATVKDYEDAKIKLHFSHFKILDIRRETCFRDEPHRCQYTLGLI